MNEEIDPEILQEFIQETSDDLDALDPQFIELENNPKDDGIINAIFRTVHSIKGASAFFNLNHMRNFAHKLENLLDELRKGERQVTGPVIDILLTGKDLLVAMLERLSAGDMSTEFGPGEAEHLALVERTLASDESAPPAGSAGDAKKQEAGISSLFVEMAALQTEITTAGPTEELLQKLFATLDKLRVATLHKKDEEKKPDEAPKLGELLIAGGVTDQEGINQALSKQKKLGDILVEEGLATREKVEDALSRQRTKSTPVASQKKIEKKKSMRIEEEKIDGFMDIVGELIISSEVFNYLQKKLEIGYDLDKVVTEFKSANVDFNELTYDLQRGLAEVRKVAITGIFQKFPRMVRDLAADIGKQVDLTITGDDILIDKSLFEQIEAPMNHIIRNAVDHGVESPEERMANGKDPAGKVSVSAEEIQGALVITVKDDGAGMDAGKLKTKALEKEIITPAEAESMSDRDAHQLVFAPGFSTAAVVTDVSGRGVGMDVVMTMVREAKGRIDIETAPGAGSSLVISMPMANTLITVSGMLVAVGSESYIIPMEGVKESLKPHPEQLSTVKKQGELVEIRDELYPLMRLHEIFDIKPRSDNPCDGVVMVIEKDERRCGLLVDEIVEETQVVLKPLGEAFQNVEGIMGCAILGDGNVGLVVSVEGVLNISTFTTTREQSQKESQHV